MRKKIFAYMKNVIQKNTYIHKELECRKENIRGEVKRWSNLELKRRLKMPDSYQACNFTVTNTFCLVAKQITENNREDLISRYFLTHFDATSIPVNPIKSLLHLTFILSFYKSFHHSIMILICMKDLIINLIKKVCRYLSL